MELATKMPGVFALIKQSLFFYKKNYKKLITIGLVFVGLIVIESIIMNLFFYGQVNLQVLSAESKVLYFVLTFVFGVVGIVAQIIMQIAFTKAVYEYDRGSSVSIKEIFKSSLKIFWPYIWITILSGLIFFGSSIFLLIPAIILGVYISFSTYALILDDKRGLNALTTSFHYTLDNWWRVFWRGLGLGLVILAILVVIGVIILAILVLSGYISIETLSAFIISFDALVKTMESMFILPIIIGIILNFVYYCVILPMFLFYSYAVYKYLKSKKSAPDHSVELRTPRGWFMGLSIFGLVLMTFLLFVFPILGIIKGYNVAKNRANNANIPSSQSLDIQFGDTETLNKSSTVNTNNTLEKNSTFNINSTVDTGKVSGNERYVSETVGFSIKPPQGWMTIENDEAFDGVIMYEAIEKDYIRKIIQIQYFDNAILSSDDVAKFFMKKVIDNSPNLDVNSLSYDKTYIGSRLTYTMSGRMPDKLVKYYFVTHEKGLYGITVGWEEGVSNEDLLTISESISSFLSTR